MRGMRGASRGGRRKWERAGPIIKAELKAPPWRGDLLNRTKGKGANQPGGYASCRRPEQSVVNQGDLIR